MIYYFQLLDAILSGRTIRASGAASLLQIIERVTSSRILRPLEEGEGDGRLYHR